MTTQLTAALLSLALSAALNVAAGQTHRDHGTAHDRHATEAHAHEHAHEHEHGQDAMDHRTRHATDEAVRAAMSKIRAAMPRTAFRLSSSEAQQLSATIEKNVSFMIEYCALPPKADAALHGIIARLMQNASALKREERRREVLTQLDLVLQDYAGTFDHPGWQ